MDRAAETVFRVGWLIDGQGGPPLKDVWLTTADGKITAWGQGGCAPPGPEIDLTDRTVIPGLIDCHVHLTMSGTDDPAIREEQINPGFDSAAAMIRTHLAQHAAAGIVAVRDGGDNGGPNGPDYPGHVIRFRSEAASDGPIVLTPGRAWRAQGRYGRLIGCPPAEGQSLAQAIARLPDGADRPDHVKIVQSGLNSLTEFGRETAPQFGLEELTEAVRAAHDRGWSVMVHANGREPVRRAILAGVDTIEHGFFMGRANLERMADSSTAWTPTAVTMAGYAAGLPQGDPRAAMAGRILEHQLEQISLADRLGVALLAGSDAGTLGVHHGSALPWEIALLIKAGLSPHEAIRAASGRAAQRLGLTDLGLLAPGRSADFIAWPGPPDSLGQPGREQPLVWRGGRPVSRPEAGR